MNYHLTMMMALFAIPMLASADDATSNLIAKDMVQTSNIAHEMAPLKSATETRQYIQSMPENLSPLNALSATERSAFVDSLRFNEKGLTQFDYTLLAKLPSDEIYRILALFGMQSSTGLIPSKLNDDSHDYSLLRLADFLLDYRCSDRATCSSAVHSACTSNC